MAASGSDAGERPTLEQRFSPWLAVRTTIHPQGLVIEVRRLFSERMATIDFDRLVLQPSSATGMRNSLLWTAGGFYAAGVLATVPAIGAWLPYLVAPALFIVAVLVLFAAVIGQQRVTMFLDREGALNPVFLRGGARDGEVAAFVDAIRMTGVAWRCDPRPVEEPEEGVEGPHLADRLDRLIDLRARALLSDREFETFREIALRP